MSKRVSAHELAELELNEAADYYESKQTGLGSLFIRTVQQAVRQISRYPESAQIVRGKARRKVLTRFPYNIIYSVEADRIRILAIANQRRRPFYWRGRH